MQWGFVPGTAPPPLTRVFRALCRHNPENGGDRGCEMPPVPGVGKELTTPVKGWSALATPYLTSDEIWKIGKYSATIMPPTTTPRNPMSSGSMSEVSASVDASTSLS